MTYTLDNYWKYYDPNKFKLFLDGKAQLTVVSFNKEDGWVERYRTDPHGNLVLNESRTDTIIERVFGEIETEGELIDN